MMQLEKVFQRIDGYRDEIIDFQRELTSRIALGPDNGGTGEHDKAEYLLEKLKELNPDSIEIIKSPDKRARDGYRPNIIARWGTEIGVPAVWVLGHMDIVPPGDLTHWDDDPYKIRVEGDKITGRGVEDNQQGIVSSYLALKAIQDAGMSLERPIGLILVADEETGSRYGLEFMLKEHGDIFKAEDLIIVPDAGNEKGTMIEVAEKSMLWIKFTVTGKQCHASTPDKGNNSLRGAARLIVSLDSLNEKFDLRDELFSPALSTFEPTKLEANVPNINTIPGKDVFYLDCRILPHYKIDDIIAEAEMIAHKIEEELKLSIHIEPVYRQESVNPTPADAPVVKALTKAIKNVAGLEAKPMGVGGGTVAAFFRQADLPAAVWMTISDSAHQPNEFCLISNVIRDCKVFASVYMDI
ncbi:M20 family metallo-hydrolase [Thermodesulfobacteriota bacterium]